ncbi:MAG: hypothetical protein IKE57_03430 [Oscillospiraceae bacterium]|nr:hypothetical protein [Oscillospiraceae bacterium]
MNDTKAGRSVAPDDICQKFVRIPESLIEEPEVCEWCEYYRDGLCVADEA